ncbi:MAG: hypothetical protein LBB18_00400, partial [Puniceicoccales bacterium]|nr:hypothetical protein [Puniceicoccales bacterium]
MRVEHGQECTGIGGVNKDVDYQNDWALAWIRPVHGKNEFGCDNVSNGEVRNRSLTSQLAENLSSIKGCSVRGFLGLLNRTSPLMDLFIWRPVREFFGSFLTRDLCECDVSRFAKLITGTRLKLLRKANNEALKSFVSKLSYEDCRNVFSGIFDSLSHKRLVRQMRRMVRADGPDGNLTRWLITDGPLRPLGDNSNCYPLLGDVFESLLQGRKIDLICRMVGMDGGDMPLTKWLFDSGPLKFPEKISSGNALRILKAWRNISDCDFANF